MRQSIIFRQNVYFGPTAGAYNIMPLIPPPRGTRHATVGCQASPTASWARLNETEVRNHDTIPIGILRINENGVSNSGIKIIYTYQV